MVLFPLAFLWLAFVVVWAIRRYATDAPKPKGDEGREWRRRPPRRPRRGPHGRPGRGGAASRAAGSRTRSAGRSSRVG